MKQTLLQTLTLVALCCALPAGASAKQPRTDPVWDKWSVGCGNSGLCFTSTFIREQSTWLDLRIVRDTPANAAPLLRITANAALNNEGTIRFDVDGTSIETLPVAQLREIQASVATPAGFRPLGGEGFWYPTGPATSAILKAMASGKALTVSLPIGDQTIEMKLPLNGLASAVSWLDDRQNRRGTVSAIAAIGTEPAEDAPSAKPILSPETLPPAVLATWDANRFCSDIDPAIFASLNAVAIPAGDDKATLYLLPCGAPSAYNTPYVLIRAQDDGKVRQLHVARMSELGPLATDLVYNARWNARDLELDGLFKGSGVGDCGTWSRWLWTGTTFVLQEEATRQTCDGQEVPISDWPTTWTVPATSK
ncbi:DUF1176 domain-containing protein [Roseibium polysiphoniae]|uniref:DUF1176 domain-containing protein n=1 Tax=Roseibium polysiphoniae TaxID=2571221 RepID=A0ABR9C956_9HYPH|nr:DUF1176 domain-containing protein [Roseibium polysiphoniae]MBD8876118.1 DUF1176 domain-containing protein [Roseibium polysiphoniae]